MSKPQGSPECWGRPDIWTDKCRELVYTDANGALRKGCGFFQTCGVQARIEAARMQQPQVIPAQNLTQNQQPQQAPPRPPIPPQPPPPPAAPPNPYFTQRPPQPPPWVPPQQPQQQYYPPQYPPPQQYAYPTQHNPYAPPGMVPVDAYGMPQHTYTNLAPQGVIPPSMVAVNEPYNPAIPWGVRMMRTVLRSGAIGTLLGGANFMSYNPWTPFPPQPGEPPQQ